jgi:hypothetical protein
MSTVKRASRVRKTPPKEVVLSFRVTRELAEQVERAAVAEDRPISNWLVLAAKRMLQQQEAG